MECRYAPRALAAVVAEGLRKLKPEHVAPHLDGADKLIVLATRSEGATWTVEAREFDAATATISGVESVAVAEPAKLDDAATAAACAVFSPLGRIVGTQDDQVRVQMKAGSIPGTSAGPCAIRPGDVFRLAARPKYVSGAPALVPHTYCVIARTEPDVTCRLETSLQLPLERLSDRRVERLVLCARPQWETTTLKVQTPDGSALPLCDVWVTRPGASAAGPREAQRWLGRTDARGELTLSAEDEGLTWLRVQRGAQTVAEFPICAGSQQEVTLNVQSPPLSLASEAHLGRLRADAMDLVAKRLLTIAAVQREIAAERFTEAEQRLAEARKLPDASESVKALVQAAGKLPANEPAAQQALAAFVRETESALTEQWEQSVEQASVTLAEAKKKAAERALAEAEELKRQIEAAALAAASSVSSESDDSYSDDSDSDDSSMDDSSMDDSSDDDSSDDDSGSDE
ncbi:MAG: hypothetical protein ACOY3P_03175 [Planctomycetota bacterium]